MTNEAIRKAVATQIKAINWAPLTKPKWLKVNREGKPDPKAYWIRPVVRMGTATGIEKGGVGIRTGVMICQVAAPFSSGESETLQYCDKIEAAFRQQSIDGLDFNEPYTVEVGKGENHRQYNVNCPFTAFVGE